jgi:hypothetical protein
MAQDSATAQIVRALVGRFGERDVAPTVEELEQTAKALAMALDLQVDISEAVEQAREQIAHRMGEGVSLTDFSEARHDPNWITKRPIAWHYSNAYLEFLKQDGWPPRVADSLGAVSRRLVSYLQDPAVDGNWDRRGLVIGHVQSGKTANYLGLVARAADAGYRFIVVVAGIHNNLRRQTQERVDEGFVGEVSDPSRKDRLRQKGQSTLIGVGIVDPSHPQRRPVALTSTADDFRKAFANSTRSRLDDWSKPIVVVIKKNRSTLVALNKWLEDFNRQPGQAQIADIPMLFIDDEADNASVNTNKPELDPTTTNRLIRQMLGLFRKSCYVGYTATPFANIFINPDPENSAIGQDLFPRHFIHCLDAPSNYFGADRLFLQEETTRKHVRAIEDCEDILPLRHGKDHELDELPESLRHAVRAFVLARAIRNVRNQTSKHCSMLVNVSRFVLVQREVGRLITEYLETLRNAIFANSALPVPAAMKNGHMEKLKATYDSEGLADAGVDWETLLGFLSDAAGSIGTAVINGDSADGLNYAEYADRNEALNVIAVGGLSLSRGLTLEGLTVSYMYRNTKMYDTLLQMGRWFGYRPGFEDLCRVWLAPDSIGWYTHISEASEELRDRVKEMGRLGGTPEKFGLMVQSHPDSLTVTALNKMRDAETRTMRVSYDGKLVETYVVSADSTATSENRDLVMALHESLMTDHPDRIVRGGQRPASKVWRGVPASVVNDFVTSFQAPPQSAEQLSSARKYLSVIKERFPVWDIAFISLRNEREEEGMTRLGDFNMVHQKRSAGTIEGRLRELDGGLFVTNNQRVAGTSDESAGLSVEEMNVAKALARDRGRETWTDRDTRHVTVRGAPLLMLHLIDLSHEEHGTEKLLLRGAPAIGLSFPATGEFKVVEYVLNRVMLRQLEAERYDTPEDDEDYDLEDRVTANGATG